MAKRRNQTEDLVVFLGVTRKRYGCDSNCFSTATANVAGVSILGEDDWFRHIFRGIAKYNASSTSLDSQVPISNSVPLG
jgi:hypothetical protein